MENIRAELKHQVACIIQRMNEKARMTMYSYELEPILYLAIYRLDFIPYNYLSIKTSRRCFNIHVINEICKCVKQAYEQGLAPYSHEGALLLQWMTSSSYQSEDAARKKKEERRDYIASYNKRLSFQGKFGFSGLFDALLLIANARGDVISPRKRKTWSLPKGMRFRKNDMHIELVEDNENFKFGWDVDLGVKLIQKNLWSCLEFAKQNKMEALTKVLFQIKHLNTPCSLINEEAFVVDCYEGQLSNVKRIEASIDELFVHIYSRRHEVHHECIQSSRTKDHLFKCSRKFETKNHSLILIGEQVDGFKSKSTYYSLFSIESYSDLIKQLGGFFEQVSAA